MNKIRLAIFASGTGSNALNIIEYFKNSSTVEIVFILSNKSDAPIVQSAINKGIPVKLFTNKEVEEAVLITEFCSTQKIDFIILAGFLRKIPEQLIALYPNKIINIHPSLLPAYGGKGMYGSNVHKAVLQNNESISGITIHFVNSEFDKGEVIAQFTCQISESETLSSLQEKIHQLEHKNFPKIIEKTILS